MKARRYEEPEPISQSDAEEAFRSGDVGRTTSALVGAAFFDEDWRWVQAWCLRLLEHSELDVRDLAATCLGHLARIHGQIDRQVVLAALEEARPTLTGRVNDAIDDIELFVPTAGEG